MRHRRFYKKVTAWKVSKYGVFCGPYFPAFGLNTEYLSVFCPNAGKYGPEKTPYLDTFHAVPAVNTGMLMIIETYDSDWFFPY